MSGENHYSALSEGNWGKHVLKEATGGTEVGQVLVPACQPLDPIKANWCVIDAFRIKDKMTLAR